MASVAEMFVKVVPDLTELKEELQSASVLGRVVRRYAHDLLFQYSEWLDSQGNIRSEKESGDTRSHDQLVADFLKQD
jgi:hypothetical protein